MFTCHEENSQGLLTEGPVQEVTEHEQAIYGTRALVRETVKDDTVWNRTLLSAGAMGGGLGEGPWEKTQMGLKMEFSLHLVLKLFPNKTEAKQFDMPLFITGWAIKTPIWGPRFSLCYGTLSFVFLLFFPHAHLRVYSNQMTGGFPVLSMACAIFQSLYRNWKCLYTYTHKEEKPEFGGVNMADQIHT